MLVGSIAAGDPNYLRRWAKGFKQSYKVSILRHHYCGLLFRGEEYLSISSIPQADFTQSEGRNAERLDNPTRERRRKLSIDPNRHAAITG
jgi:hypothetical protein